MFYSSIFELQTSFIVYVEFINVFDKFQTFTFQINVSNMLSVGGQRKKKWFAFYQRIENFT